LGNRKPIKKKVFSTAEKRLKAEERRNRFFEKLSLANHANLNRHSFSNKANPSLIVSQSKEKI
jgi:hypothetical protein